jgi:protein involved in polysaccharide export with SLBB domain
MKKSCAAFALVAAAAALHPAVLAAQTGQEWEAGQLYATRAELEAMLGRFEGATNASIYSDAVRMPARDEADLIRARLLDGDFEVGDVITLTVAGQPDLTNNFTVAAGRLLILPNLPTAMPLQGLLRSELRDSLSAFIATYIRDPQVFVQTSMRLQAVGEVGNVGYHSVSAESRLPDVIASIGQPTRSADLDEMKIKRGDETIWEGEALQEAIVQGRTMDQLSLRAGDIIEVPGQSNRNLGDMIRSLYYLVPLTFAIMRLF